MVKAKILTGNPRVTIWQLFGGRVPGDVNYMKITCNFNAKKGIFLSFYYPDCSKRFALESNV